MDSAQSGMTTGTPQLVTGFIDRSVPICDLILADGRPCTRGKDHVDYHYAPPTENEEQIIVYMRQSVAGCWCDDTLIRHRMVNGFRVVEVPSSVTGTYVMWDVIQMADPEYRLGVKMARPVCQRCGRTGASREVV